MQTELEATDQGNQPEENEQKEKGPSNPARDRKLTALIHFSSASHPYDQSPPALSMVRIWRIVSRGVIWPYMRELKKFS